MKNEQNNSTNIPWNAIYLAIVSVDYDFVDEKQSYNMNIQYARIIRLLSSPNTYIWLVCNQVKIEMQT